MKTVADFTDAALADLRIELCTANRLASALPAWQDLADAASEANFFYAPTSLLPAARYLDGADRLHMVLVWQTRPTARQLIGAFPLAIGPLGRHLSMWMSPYFVSAAPLLRRGFEQAALHGLLRWADRRRPRPVSLLLPQIDLDGAAFAALKTVAQRDALPLQVTAVHERAMLDLTAAGRHKQTGYIRRSRRKDLARRWRKLSALGQLSHSILHRPEELRHGLAAFLQLEKAGWKGRMGTALACRSRTRNFALAAYGPQAGTHATRCELLTLDGRPIAASLTLLAGKTGWAVKSAYDESYARFAPGLLNDYATLRTLLASDSDERIDSAALPGHVLEELWAGRRRTADVVLGLRPGLSPHVIARRIHFLTVRRTLRQRLTSSLRRWWRQAR